MRKIFLSILLLVLLGNGYSAELLIGKSITDKQQVQLKSEEKSREEAIRSRKGAKAVAVAALNSDAINSNEISVTLPSGEIATYRSTQKSNEADGAIVWKGSSSTELIADRPRDVIRLFASPSKSAIRASYIITGFCVWHGAEYEIDSLNENTAVVIELGSARDPMHPPDWHEIQQKHKSDAKSSATEGRSLLLSNQPFGAQSIYTANILFAITPQAVSYYGSTLQNRMDSMVSNANSILAANATSLRLTKVGVSYRALDYSWLFAH